MARSRVSFIENVPGFGVDTSGLTELAAAMRQASVKTKVEWRLGLRAVGEIIATEAREKAREHSDTIPGTIKVRAARNTVEVRAGTKTDPLARLFEVGNSSAGAKRTRDGKFWHPVFGDRDPGALQDMHPFLAVSGRLKEQEAKEALADVIASSLRSVGIQSEPI